MDSLFSCSELLHLCCCRFSQSGVYYCPDDNGHQSFVDYITDLPIIPNPEVFGLHDNADITKDNQETQQVTINYLNILNTRSGLKYFFNNCSQLKFATILVLLVFSVWFLVLTTFCLIVFFSCDLLQGGINEQEKPGVHHPPPSPIPHAHPTHPPQLS